MLRAHHQIPTHLNVEDKVLFGLTGRQFLTILIGVSLAYSIWNQLALPVSLRVPVTIACVGLTLVTALIRPGERPLEQWALVALIYVARPKCSTWRPAQPDSRDWHATVDDGWAEASPALTWSGEELR